LALFGSGATERFNAEKGSDLDFLVEFEPRSPQAHADAYFGLMEDMQRTLGVPIDLVEAGASRNPYFQEAVRNTQVVLFEAASRPSSTSSISPRPAVSSTSSSQVRASPTTRSPTCSQARPSSPARMAGSRAAVERCRRR
jgi:predicted nucleotidyltransferase